MLALLLLTPLYADTCTGGYADPVQTGAVTDAPMVESSGLARAHHREGVWFTHGDAGGKAEIHAFRLDGAFVETHAVPDGVFVDWEDMSGGPCPDPADGHCIYVGDIGDNGRTRQYVWVYAVREPLAGEDGVVVATWKGNYPNGPEDAETLFVHPYTGRIYAVTKRYDDVADVYRFPAAPNDDPVDLEYIATLDFSGWGATNIAATGGDWDATADRLVIRTYSHAFEWITDPCDPDAHWSDTPTVIRTQDRQGEAIAYDGEGDLVTVSEGSPAEITRITCQGITLGGGDCFDTAVEGIDPRGNWNGGCGDDGAAPPETGLAPTERHVPGIRYKQHASSGRCTTGAGSWRWLWVLAAAAVAARRRYTTSIP